MSPQFYNENSNELAQQYLSKSFEQVHQSWSQFVQSVIKNPQPRILDIIHCMAFARCPNDEPSASRKIKVESSTSLIKKQSQRFFAEANIALPGLNSNNSSVDDFFEALAMQRERLKRMQQLREW